MKNPKKHKDCLKIQRGKGPKPINPHAFDKRERRFDWRDLVDGDDSFDDEVQR